MLTNMNTILTDERETRFLVGPGNNGVNGGDFPPGRRQGEIFEPDDNSSPERAVVCWVSREELAALELLRSTGAGVLESAQVSYAVLTRFSLKESSPVGTQAYISEIPPVSLVQRVMLMLDAGEKTLEQRDRTESFEKVAWASVESRAGRRPTTTRDLRHYVRRMLKVEGVSQLPLRSMTTAQCRQLLQVAFGHSVHSFRKGRSILHSIFAYGMRQEWCDSNPVSRIESPTVQEKQIVPLTNEEVGRLHEKVQERRFHDMRFSLSLLLYSGIRPAEVERISPEDICWEERQVIVRPQKSKTGGGRVVPLRMLPGIKLQDCLIPRNWQRRWQSLRKAAGFNHWVPDVCRHTFASYHAAHFRNLSELQLEMGHRDVSLLRSRYMSPANRKTAAAFWKRTI